MEVLYLLGSIIWNTVASLGLSLLLPFRILLRRVLCSSKEKEKEKEEEEEGITLYEGIVWHQRRHPIKHSFEYKVRYALIDLDRSPHFLSSTHLSAHQARNIAATSGPVFLLTIPPSVGYEQNPLSLYYCYELEHCTSSLKKCIAEVTNTPWGERVSFVFNPSSDLAAKALHVSPFMDMQGNWIMKATTPAEDLSVVISVQHPNLGEYFCAILRAKRVCSSKVPDHLSFFWLMPHKVAVWIYWHGKEYRRHGKRFPKDQNSSRHPAWALKLWWKSIPFIQHPRYTNPAYREEAASRDKRINCCSSGGFETSDSCPRDDINVISRQFTWTNAKWPWS